MIARRGEYGIDAPYVPALFFVGALVSAALAVVTHGGLSWIIAGVLCLVQAALYLHTTRRGKMVVWDEVLEAQRLRGDERLLDVGCGRGVVLLLAAQRLPRGHATGIDLWSTTDQSGNAEATTRANAVLEGVGDRVTLCTGDMKALPFPDASFDVAVSNVAIHSLSAPQDRQRALAEIARVLAPGGTALLADFRHVAEYDRGLAELGLSTERRSLGWRTWYGGPQAAMSLVTARKAQ